MRNSFLFLIFLFLSLRAISQTESDVIDKANSLIADKKYESAFDALENFDTKNASPDIVLLKEKIALNYYITSIMHQMFTFKDLKAGEDIMDYRGKSEETQNIHMFPINDILDSLIQLYPANCKLKKGLGDYLFDYNLRYGNMLAMSADSMFELIDKNYKKAIDGNCADYKTYYVMGYMNIANEKYTEGIPYLKKSIDLDSTYASSFYNLAFAYMQLDKNDSALQFATKALALYDDTVYKGDAARMIGSIYMGFKDNTKAITFYELSNKIDPGNYYTLRALLYLYVMSNDSKESKTLNDLFLIAPNNSTIYGALANVYFTANKTETLISFYNSQLSKYKKDPEVLGNLNFFLAQLYLDKDKKMTKKYLLKSKENFSKVYKADHQVFKVIDAGLESLK